MNDLDIIRMRKEFDLTQAEFAKMIGVDRRTIINYEQGTKIPESKVKLINMTIEGMGPAEMAELKSKKKPEVKYVQDDNLSKEIIELKDHITTLKQLISEKTTINEYLQKEIESLRAENQALRVSK